MTQTPKTHLRFLQKVKDKLNNFYRTLALKHNRTFLKAGLYLIEKSFSVFFFFFNLVVKYCCQNPDSSRGSASLFSFSSYWCTFGYCFYCFLMKISPILCLKNDYFSGRLHLTWNFRKYTLKRSFNSSVVLKK